MNSYLSGEVRCGLFVLRYIDRCVSVPLYRVWRHRYKQRGKEALKANNLFYYLTYEVRHWVKQV